MSRNNGHSGSASVNAGSASRPTAEERNREFEISGNAALKAEKPSPGSRERGEHASSDPATAADLDLDS